MINHAASTDLLPSLSLSLSLTKTHTHTILSYNPLLSVGVPYIPCPYLAVIGMFWFGQHWHFNLWESIGERHL